MSKLRILLSMIYLRGSCGYVCPPMVYLLIVAIAVVTPAVAATLPSSNCPELVTEKPISVSKPAKQQACVTVIVFPGEATQVVVEHPQNVSLRVIAGETKKETLASGFEFGQETITLNSAGHYQIQVDVAAAEPKSSAQLYMSRKALPLQAAPDWQAAEALAAASKQSATIPGILASLQRWQALQQPSPIARTWLKLGDAVLAAGDLNRAYDAYERALALCRSIDDVRCTAEAAHNSGYVAQQLGNFSNAFDRLDEAIKKWKVLSLPL